MKMTPERALLSIKSSRSTKRAEGFLRNGSDRLLADKEIKEALKKKKKEVPKLRAFAHTQRN